VPRSAGDGTRVVVLGKVGAPFGVQGWVRVVSYTDPPEGIAGYASWRIGSSGARRSVLEWKRVGRGQIAVRLEGVVSPEEARLLTGEPISVERGELSELPPGEYYREDLLGLEAVNREGEALGVVDGFIELPAHAVVVLRGERERLVPLTSGRLVKVDLDAGRVTFDWHVDD
jgi:16S rRNA processing protein RimM